jgi:hypothetical protein
MTQSEIRDERWSWGWKPKLRTKAKTENQKKNSHLFTAQATSITMASLHPINIVQNISFSCDGLPIPCTRPYPSVCPILQELGCRVQHGGRTSITVNSAPDQKLACVVAARRLSLNSYLRFAEKPR